jgi:hypothetical protein
MAKKKLGHGFGASLLVLVIPCAGGSEGEMAQDRMVEGGGEELPTQQESEYQDLLGNWDGRFHKGGWNHYGPGYFDLDPETGVLTSHGGMGLFWYSVKEFEDFELQLDFRCADKNTNSGVFLRVPGVPTSDDYIHHSFEVQINDSDNSDGGIHLTGSAYDAQAPTHLASNTPGEWNHFKITFVGDRLRVELNGQEVLDWEAEPRGKIRDFAPRGYIGLQNHDDRSPVYFRNIRVKELGS